jgi:UDPglucose 6-dehydrogenase
LSGYASNAFLATKIAFINQIADLSEKVGADVQEVARGSGLDNHIGLKFAACGNGLRRANKAPPCDTMRHAMPHCVRHLTSVHAAFFSTP